MEVFDTHCHLTSGDLAPRADAVIADARAAGVTRMITIACTAAELPRATALARRHERVYVAAGVHPHEAARATPEDFVQLETAWRGGGVVAVGETGLDYHYDFSPRDVQQTVFRRQLDLAQACGLPVIIHAREAHADVVRLLLAHGWEGRRVVFHCFSGTPEEAAELHHHGWYTSFTGVITFRKAEAVQQACAAAPLDRLFFETDAPYLSPEPVRKMRPNEPRNVVHTVAFAGRLRGMQPDELAEISTAIALRFFGVV